MLTRETALSIYRRGADATVKALLELDAQVERLTTRVAGLSKNSSNSSKPPSSDIVKPPNHDKHRRTKKKLKKGGQPGHPKWDRAFFGHDEVQRIEYKLNACPHCNCNGTLQQLPDKMARIIQQVELQTPAAVKLEHRASGYWLLMVMLYCTKNGKVKMYHFF